MLRSPASNPSTDGNRHGRLTLGWRVLVALAVLYFVWGSTYLAIKVAIESIPPLLMAAVRFIIAGALLLAWAIPRGRRRSDPLGWRQWGAAAIVGGALLLVGNGGVVLAEHRGVPTGIVALIVATVPLWMAVMDWVVARQRLPRIAVGGLVLGFAGLALLVGRPGGHADALGTGIVILASFSWAAGSVYSRRAPLPRRAFVASGMELLCGGALLAVAGAASGELGAIHLSRITTGSVVGLVYLILIGSIVAYSAYVWLLASAPLSIAGTYAYVNPVVAVLLGWAFLSEAIGARTVIASAVILAGVALIVTSRSAQSIPPPTDAPPPEPPGGVTGARAAGQRRTESRP
jgi:drug/metabolite transporter (DMT)-like permease